MKIEYNKTWYKAQEGLSCCNCDIWHDSGNPTKCVLDMASICKEKCLVFKAVKNAK